jgi:hypothetical protein
MSASVVPVVLQHRLNHLLVILDGVAVDHMEKLRLSLRLPLRPFDVFVEYKILKSFEFIAPGLIKCHLLINLMFLKTVIQVLKFSDRVDYALQLILPGLGVLDLFSESPLPLLPLF